MHRNCIAGESRNGPSATDKVNPSDTNDVIGQYTLADEAQARQAIAAAHEASTR